MSRLHSLALKLRLGNVRVWKAEASFRQGCNFAAIVLLLGAVWLPMVRAEDLTTLSGTTYHDVRMVRTDPDGIVWEHATGQCKVDFADLPERVRAAYHYDDKRVAAYQAEQAQARQQAAEQSQRNQQEAATWRAKQLQSRTAILENENAAGTHVFRRGTDRDAAERSVGEDIAAKTAKRDFLTKDDGTIWDRRLWAIPVLIFGGNPFDGVAFDPHTDFNSHEYQSTLHHSVGGFAADSNHEGFFQPDYLTKAYRQDLDRAEAFARGHP